MNVIIGILIILKLSYLIVRGIASPCPKIFRYEIEEKSQNYTGHIEIENPPQLSPINVKVIMSLAGILPTRYVGRLKLKKTKPETIRDLRSGDSIQYVVDFPIQDPLPKLTDIWVNEKKYCSGPRAMSDIVTTLTYEHNLYTPLQTPPTVENSSQSLNQCGIISENIEKNNQSTQLASPEQWPWLVAIFFVEIQMEYKCAGTLITEKHVLSAAHCFKLKEEYNVPANAIVVSLGRYRLRDWNDPKTINTEVLDYQIHPNYKGPGSADSDLAILFIKDKININRRIRPICLWSSDTDLDRVVGKNAWLVDWGKDKSGDRNFEESRVSQVPIISQEDCLLSHTIFALQSSNRTFCAGRKDAKGICNWDSGSGLAVFDSITKRYSLRGIVSTAVFDQSANSCDPNHYVIYVDVAKYLNWIRIQISRKT